MFLQYFLSLVPCLLSYACALHVSIAAAAGSDLISNGFDFRMGCDYPNRGDFIKQSILSSAGVIALPRVSSALGRLPETKERANFIQHAVINVPNMEDAIKFYVEGIGMKVLRSRSDSSTNVTFVGFGPETLDIPETFIPGVSSFSEYGGHFSLELVAPSNDKNPTTAAEVFNPGNGFQFLQVAVESYRISKVIKSGGTVLSGYGYLETVAPGGLRVNLFSGIRRDPMMFVALKVNDIKKSLQWYKEVLGMSQLPYPQARNVPDSPFEPRQPNKSVFIGYDGDATGILLIPKEKNDRGPIVPGTVYGKLAILGENVEEMGKAKGALYSGKAPGTDTSIAAFVDPDGYGSVLVEYSDFEEELR